MKLAYPVPLPVLAPAVFVSGATALIYEIVWARQLSLVLGSTTGAAAAVLSAFMFGLAVGAVAIGGSADRSRRPLRWYGLLELGIGAYAFAFGSLLDMAGGGWLASCAVVALPAALMGATLPVLARAAADTTERGTRAFGSLYGVNTLGAVAGALLATFVLLKSVGLSGATHIAAYANIGLGLAFCVLDPMTEKRAVFRADKEGARPPWTGDAEIGILAAFFVAGFAGLALEMAWVRLLVYFLEGFTIAFGLMLATYLLGLGLGALAGTVLAVRSGNPRRLLGRVLLVQAVLALATFLLTGPISDRLESMREGYATADAIDAIYGLGLFWAAAFVILPATFCGGMLMPIVARITLSERESIGRQTGAVYAASTLGAVIAPPVAGFLLIPALGVPGTIACMAAVLLASGTWLALSRGLKEWSVAGAAATVFVVLFLVADLGTPLVERSHVFRAARSPRRLVTFKEGKLGGVSVVEEYRTGSRRLYIDGFSAAETGRHYGYMRMLGHLPVLLHPKPENVLVIAFGTGTTAGAAALHDEVKKVTCVEIEPAVFDVASEFGEVNHDILNSAKTEAVVADGREYVARGKDRFDVITLEPLMPYTPGAVYLYTKEFYEAARESLRGNGLLCQWIPPQGVSNADLKRLVASMTSVFRHVSLWYFEHAVLVLGGDYAPSINHLTFIKRCAKRGVFDDLVLVVGGPDHLLAAHVCSDDALRKALADVDPFEDNLTDLEFRPLPRRFGRRSQTYHAENLEFLSSIHQADVAWLADAKEPAITGARAVARAGMGAALGTLALELRRRIEGGKVVPASVLRDVVERDPLGAFARSIYDRRRYAELLGEEQWARAAALQRAPDRSGAFLELANGSEGERRRFYQLLALRENALLPPEVLRELAGQLDGPEKRFCLNRARVQAGEPIEPGPEKLPAPPPPDLGPALLARDAAAVRIALEMGRSADVERAMENQLWKWWQAEADKRAATLFLHEIGSSKAVQAARKLRSEDDQAAVAVVYAAAYPRLKTWERLCRHRSARVREAAADAAAALAHVENARTFLPILVGLLDDSEEGVRLSAYIAFRGIHPGAESLGYDHRKPTKEAIAALAGLADG